MTGERGQVLVEAVVVVPACLASALAIVDCGTLVRDRMAVAQAASRAAEAHVAGAPVARAARGAVPPALRRGISVDVADGRVVVSAASRTALTDLAGIDVVHRSSVVTEVAR